MGFMQLSSFFNLPFYLVPVVVAEVIKSKISYEPYLDFLLKEGETESLSGKLRRSVSWY